MLGCPQENQVALAMQAALGYPPGHQEALSVLGHQSALVDLGCSPGTPGSAVDMGSSGIGLDRAAYHSRQNLFFTVKKKSVRNSCTRPL
ncbi:hypothetical protein MHYP_G00217460 [Metynnis hypsauchen]